MSAVSTARRAPRALKPVYPAYPKTTDHPQFWLAHFLRDSAKHEALLGHYHKVGKQTGWAEDPLLDAIGRAERNQHDEIAKQAKYVQEEGTLLFAWSHTKAFEAVPA